MQLKTMILSLGLGLVAASGQAAASDMHVTCVQRQLAALGYNPGPADGLDGQDTRRALSDFLSGVIEDSARAVFDGLPDFSRRAAVGWCREIAAYKPDVKDLTPAAEPPMILTADSVSPEIRSYVARSYEEARRTFAREWGIETASKPVLIVAFNRDDLEELLKRPVPGIPDLSPGAARDTADDMCIGVERVEGSAYRHRVSFCMPQEHQQSITSYKMWKARYQYVMLHEFMHHVQREMSYDKVEYDESGHRRMGPAWMVEGTAYLAEIKARGAYNQKVSVPMLSALRAGDEDDPLELEWIRKKDSVRSHREYSASNLATSALAMRYGEDRIVDFWRAVGELDDWDRAFERTFDMEIDQFEGLFEELRTDNAKLIKFATGKAPYALDKPLFVSVNTDRKGHAARGLGIRF